MGRSGAAGVGVGVVTVLTFVETLRQGGRFALGDRAPLLGCAGCNGAAWGERGTAIRIGESEPVGPSHSLERRVRVVHCRCMARLGNGTSGGLTGTAAALFNGHGRDSSKPCSKLGFEALELPKKLEVIL